MAIASYIIGDDCGRKPSGLASIHIQSSKEVTSLTFDATNNNYSAITMNGTAVMSVIQFKQGEAQLDINAEVENDVTKFTNTITVKGEKLSEKYLALIQSLADHSYCGMTAIATTFYGERYVIGYDKDYAHSFPLELSAGPLSSGRGLTGEQGGDIVLVAESPQRPFTLDSSVTIPV